MRSGPKSKYGRYVKHLRVPAAGADIDYVRTLHLAASTTESRVEAALRALLDRGNGFDFAAARDLAAPATPTVEVR